MGFFANMYYSSFIATYSPASVGTVLESVITMLSPEEQVEVLERLGRYLVGKGLVQETVSEYFTHNITRTLTTTRFLIA